MEKVPKLESKEFLEYDLTINVHRHGPKIGTEGPLSEEGKEVSRNYFNEAYEGVPLDESGELQVEYSPIHRARQTANIYSEALSQTGAGKVKSISEDERLSEGGVAENKEVLNKLLEDSGTGGAWVKAWLDMEKRPSPEVKTGAEAVSDFSSWLLEKVGKAQEKGGRQEVDAFSHGPVMLAFLIRLQERTGQQILPEGWRDQDILSDSLKYLSNIQIQTDSLNPEEVKIRFNRQEIAVPLELINEL